MVPAPARVTRGRAPVGVECGHGGTVAARTAYMRRVLLQRGVEVLERARVLPERLVRQANRVPLSRSHNVCLLRPKHTTVWILVLIASCPAGPAAAALAVAAPLPRR